MLEIRAEIEPGDAAEVGLSVRGVPVIFDAKQQEISVNGHRSPAPLRDGKQHLVIFADRTSLEVFASDGLTYVPMPVMLDAKNTSLTAFAKGGTAKAVTLEVHELKSIWNAAAK